VPGNSEKQHTALNDDLNMPRQGKFTVEILQDIFETGVVSNLGNDLLDRISTTLRQIWPRR
jgi:hypothetical protein